MEQFEDFLEWAEECIATGKLFSSPASLRLLWAGAAVLRSFPALSAELQGRGVGHAATIPPLLLSPWALICEPWVGCGGSRGCSCSRGAAPGAALHGVPFVSAGASCSRGSAPCGLASCGPAALCPGDHICVCCRNAKGLLLVALIFLNVISPFLIRLNIDKEASC